MEIRALIIYVQHGKAYIPRQAQFESGIFTDVEPVRVAELNVEGIASVLRELLALEVPQLPDPTAEEWMNHKHLVLAATRARTWKELARTGVCYAIAWTAEQVRIDMSRLDKRGRWEYDPAKVRVLPPDTTLEAIAGIVLDDVRLRAETASDLK